MSAYIRRLIEGSAARAEAIAKAKLDADDVRKRMTPLIDRLRKLIEEVPREVQAAGIPLRLLQEGLKGRVQGLAYPGELAACLRELGWFKRRFVRETSNFLWFPPWTTLKTLEAMRLKPGPKRKPGGAARKPRRKPRGVGFLK